MKDIELYDLNLNTCELYLSHVIVVACNKTMMINKLISVVKVTLQTLDWIFNK